MGISADILSSGWLGGKEKQLHLKKKKSECNPSRLVGFFFQCYSSSTSVMISQNFEADVNHVNMLRH